jgi:TrmH family RNA methyltransferase
MITSTSNRLVKQVRALQSRRSARREEGLFVLEGIRQAYEVVAEGLPVHSVLHTDNLNERGRGLVNTLARLGADVHVVSEGVMKAASDTESPPGILLTLPMPKISPPEVVDFVLIIDRLADPGNMGTILRTAFAAGAQAVHLTKGTVDPYNPKVVRAAMGAHLRLSIGYIDDQDNHPFEGLEILIAERGAGLPYYQVDWRSPFALVIGSETRGPGDTMRSLASGGVHIPVRDETESLNAAVAAGVILFEVARQRSGLSIQ